METHQKYEKLIEKIKIWAGNANDIRAAFILGSRARTEKPADAWSDLDLTIISVNPSHFLHSTDWIAQIDGYWLTFLEKTADGAAMERRVMFEDGLDVDFVFLSTVDFQNITRDGMPDHVKYTVQKGIKLLLDKDGLFQDFINMHVDKIASAPPSEKDYLNVVNDFLYHYVWTLKKLKRKELWAAKFCLDSYMKWKLLQMIEWHAHCIKGWDYNTWHEGRFLDEWADSKVPDVLKRSFAYYDHNDIARALKETLKLFQWLALEVAEKLNFSYPAPNEQRALKWAEENLMAYNS